jgi:hypothetical protein
LTSTTTTSSSSPSLIASTSSGTVGQTISFHASGLAPNKYYSFNLDNSQKQFIVEIKSFVTNSSGSYSGTFNVPKEDAGSYFLSVATAGTATSKTVVRTSFSVVSGGKHDLFSLVTQSNMLTQFPSYQMLLILGLLGGTLSVGLLTSPLANRRLGKIKAATIKLAKSLS